MIKSEEVRQALENMRADVIDFRDIIDVSSYSSDADYTRIDDYITEQEKKDELLELYKKLHDTYRYPTWKSVKDVQCILKQIKALEEKMK